MNKSLPMRGNRARCPNLAIPIRIPVQICLSERNHNGDCLYASEADVWQLYRQKLQQLEEIDWTGCNTGDCPHASMNECIEALSLRTSNAERDTEELRSLIEFAEEHNVGFWKYSAGTVQVFDGVRGPSLAVPALGEGETGVEALRAAVANRNPKR